MSRYLVEKTKTTGQGWQSSNRYFENCGERSLGQFLSVSFLVAYYILPQYFGIRLPGFDLTAQRMLITILCLFLLSKESRRLSVKWIVEYRNRCTCGEDMPRKPLDRLKSPRHFPARGTGAALAAVSLRPHGSDNGSRDESLVASGARPAPRRDTRTAIDLA